MGAIKTAYLVAYNAASLAGWGYILYLMGLYYVEQLPKGSSLSALPAVLTNPKSHTHVYEAIHPALDVVQTAAALEIVHSMLGLVRSPFFTTFLQVMSRILVLWAIVHLSPPSQHHWGFALMAFSWALVEVPRYLFYIVKLIGEGSDKPAEGAPKKDSVPYWLKWLRYSLFIVLYPSGISGEIICLLNSLDYIKSKNIWHFDLPNTHNLVYNHYLVLSFLLLTYAPGGPFMFYHMWTQRKKELSGEKPKTA